MENNEPSNPFVSIHTPVALVALALSVLFFSQIKGVGTATETMKWQSSNADKQIIALKENREKLAGAIEERKALVAQSEQTQKQFTDLMKEVDELARGGDKDAKTIIEGYGIKVNEPGGAPRASTDSKEPAKAKK
jgi:hypothetical protein